REGDGHRHGHNHSHRGEPLQIPQRHPQPQPQLQPHVQARHIHGHSQENRPGIGVPNVVAAASTAAAWSPSPPSRPRSSSGGSSGGGNEASFSEHGAGWVGNDRAAGGAGGNCSANAGAGAGDAKRQQQPWRDGLEGRAGIFRSCSEGGPDHGRCAGLGNSPHPRTRSFAGPGPGNVYGGMYAVAPSMRPMGPAEPAPMPPPPPPPPQAATLHRYHSADSRRSGSFGGYDYSTMVSCLDRNVENFMQKLGRAMQPRRRAWSQVIARVRELVAGIWKEARLEMYGSCYTGLELPSSDVDVVVCGISSKKYAYGGGREGYSTLHTVSNLQKLANVLQEQTWVRGMKVRE
ncbi:unnamed protein product, partial [Choristocarpus tenellus]